MIAVRRQPRPTHRVRPQVNRLVVAAGLVVALPAIALAERLHPGGGRRIAHGLLRVLARVCGVVFEVHGVERLRPSPSSYVFVPNHSSPLDIPAMLVAHPDMRFMAAADLYRNPLLAGAMRALGTVAIDRHDRANAHCQLATLAERPEPLCLTVFAEGKIAPSGELLPFKAGAFELAIQTRATVVPVAIHRAATLLPPGGRLSVRPGLVTVELLEPISTAGLSTGDRGHLNERVRHAVMAALRDNEPDGTVPAT